MRVFALLVAVVVCSSACASGSQPGQVSPAAASAAETSRTAAPAAVAATPAPADPTPPGVRLPGDVVPRRYALDFTIVPDQATAAGRVHITAEVTTATRVVWLNASGLTIAHAELDGKPARVIAGGDDAIGLAADRALAAGPLAIDVAFTAPIDRGKSRGIYSEQEGSDRYVYTFFEPIDARRAFPCFDEPGFKVPWRLTFHVKAEHVALANAAVEREVPEAGGMKRVELAETRPLPSYLVAFVVGPFELVDGGSTGRAATPIRFIIPKGRAGELGYARQITPKVVAALEDYFDMAYPYGKLDVAVVPRFWGTMEHPGIVAMGQPLTLIRPDQATRERKASYTRILAHELSHYWFGDLVTMAWWSDTWLNEALGEWSDMNITEAAEPSWRVRDERVGIAERAMSADEALVTRAIRRQVTTREGIEASFDNAITYYKGSSVFRMFEAFAGRDAWRGFIRSYLRAHAWGNATADDFVREAGDQLGAPIAAAMRTFLEQPGVPRISGELSCAAGAPPRLILAQQRALPADARDPSPKQWALPVCVRYGTASSSGRACTLMAAPSATLELTGAACPTWTLLNADAVGYYRSAVDPAVARALLTPGSAIARAAKPSAGERMMLIEDLSAAVKRDELPRDQLLALAPVIAADPDDKVAIEALIAATMPLRGLDDAMYAAGRAWLGKVFLARGRRLGWQRAAGDSDEREQLRRGFVLQVAQDDPVLAAEAARLADAWLVHRSGLPDDLVGSALVVAARHGDAARFDRYLAAARAPRDRNEQARLLAAIGGFTAPALAGRALDLLLGRDLDLRDSISIAFSVLNHRETRDLGLAFVTAHLDDLLARMRDDEAAGLLGGLAGLPCDPERRAKIAALVEPRARKYDGAQNAVERSLEQVDHCIAQVQRELPALRRVLGAH